MLRSISITILLIITGVFSSMTNALEIYGHRGFAGLYPEGTLWGYEEILKLGVHSVDVDVALTKDNIVVVSHDPYLNKDLTRDPAGKWLSNNKIKIIDLTFAELQKYDIGKINPKSIYSKKYPLQIGKDNLRIPSLVQVINLIKTFGHGAHKIQIEIKTEPKRDSDQYVHKFVDVIIDTLEKNNFLDRAELQSFDWRGLLYAKKINPKIKTSFITEKSFILDTLKGTSWTAGHSIRNHENSVIKMLSTLGADTWCPYYKNVTKELVAQAHAHNIRVVPWTPDLPVEMNNLIQVGVDGIITNRADILRKVLSELSIPVP
jgi:glycerophosphoryl diester phosphodiesterase